jgi:hypothetical protein
MRNIVVFVAVLASTALGTSLNAAPPQSNVNAAGSAGTHADKKICESIKLVGSRLAVKRICATGAEWAERRKRDREDAINLQSTITGAACGIKTNGKPEC